MSKNKTIGYLRVSPKVADIDNRIEVMSQATQDMLLIEKGVRGNVPLNERPEFKKAYSQLEAGDTLMIWWMTDFGLGFKLAYDVITELLAKNISVKTYHQDLIFKPNDEQTSALLRLLKGYEEVETKQRLMAAELGRRKLRGHPDQWEAKFQGRRANQELHVKIIELLATDKTLQAIADETGSSISTVKRVKAKLKQRETGPNGHKDRAHKHRSHNYHKHNKHQGRRHSSDTLAFDKE